MPGADDAEPRRRAADVEGAAAARRVRGHRAPRGRAAQRQDGRRARSPHGAQGTAAVLVVEAGLGDLQWRAGGRIGKGGRCAVDGGPGRRFAFLHLPLENGMFWVRTLSLCMTQTRE